MQTSNMSNNPKLSEPSPLQTIVLWRQIKTMIWVCKNSGPHSAQIKVAEPIGMLKSLCSNQCAARIKPQNDWSARKKEEKWIGCLLECEISVCGTILLFQIWLQVTFQIFCSVCVTSVWIRSSPAESVWKCYTSHTSGPKLQPGTSLEHNNPPPKKRSVPLPGIYWSPVRGLHADRLKSIWRTNQSQTVAAYWRKHSKPGWVAE